MSFFQLQVAHRSEGIVWVNNFLIVISANMRSSRKFQFFPTEISTDNIKYMFLQHNFLLEQRAVQCESFIFATFTTNINSILSLLKGKIIFCDICVNMWYAYVYALYMEFVNIYIKERTDSNKCVCISLIDCPKWTSGSRPNEAVLIIIALTPQSIISWSSSTWSLLHKYARQTHPSLLHL